MSEHEKSGAREGFEGVAEDVKGKAKAAAGTVVGNQRLRREGQAQQDRAESQRAAARKEAEKERAEAAADELASRADR